MDYSNAGGMNFYNKGKGTIYLDPTGVLMRFRGNTTGGTNPPKMRIQALYEANTAAGDVYAALEFGVNGADGSAGDLTNGVIASIKAIDYRAGTTSYEDSGLGFYTAGSGDITPVFRGGFSNLGGFSVGAAISNVDPGELYVHNKIGINKVDPDYPFHLMRLDTGVAAPAWADDFFIESTANVGISIATADTTTGYLIFGSPFDNQGGYVGYTYASGSPVMKVGTHIVGGELQLKSGNDATALTFDTNGVATFYQNVNLADGGLSVTRNGGSYVWMKRNTTTTATHNTIGYVDFRGGNVSQDVPIARILALADEDFTDTSSATKLYFYTTVSGNTGHSLRMTLDSTGYLGIGTSTPTRHLHVQSAGTNVGAVIESTDSSARLSLMDNSSSSDSSVGIGALGDELSLYSNSATRMHISSAGDVGIGTGTTTPEAMLDIADGNMAMVLGANSAVHGTRTNLTDKVARVGAYHYTNAEEPSGLLFASNTSTANTIGIGGGSSLFNAATRIVFYTAANSTTLTGTNRMEIRSDGAVGIGTAGVVDGTFHVVTNSAGTVVANGNADELVIENNASAGISIINPDANLGSLYFGDVSDNDVASIRYSHANDDMFFTVGTTETLRLHSELKAEFTGNVTVGGGGLASGDGTLHVYTASAGAVSAHSSLNDLVVEGSGDTGISVLTPNTSAGARIGMGSPADSLGAMMYYTYGDGSAPIVQIGTTTTNGKVRFLYGDAVAAVDIEKTGVVNFLKGQLQFPAAINKSTNANTLDDYEEGTWTPVLGGSTSETGQTYTRQSGFYQKVGNWVHCQGFILLSAAGTISGSLQIQGLPFLTGSDFGDNAAVTFSNPIYWTLTSGHILTGQIGLGVDYIQLYETNFNNDAATTITQSKIGNNTGITVSFSYRVN
jgi:hypothetical protein